MSKACLLTLARRQLSRAHNSSDGRSMHVVNAGTQLQHAIVALRDGQRLDAGAFAGAAQWTAQVLQGRVRMDDRHSWCVGWPGDLLTGSSPMNVVKAECDAVLLVTSIAGDGPEPSVPNDRGAELWTT